MAHPVVVQSFLTTISKRIEKEDLPALMIGGHAVTALGHPRATYDLNLLIPRSAVARWKAVLVALEYHVFADSEQFLQFEAPYESVLPPVDFMLVDEDVFQTLECTKTDTKPIATPRVEAMIALKLHAIKQPGRDDTEKDWSDILALINVHHLTLDDPEFSAMVLKHGGETAIQRIRAASAGGN